MTTKITEQNISNLANIGVQWQSVFTGDGSTGLTAVAGRGYFIDTTSGTVEVTLPASPSVGDVVVLKDYARTWNTNNVTLASALLDAVTTTSEFSTNGQTVTIVYMDGTKGWSLINEDTTTGLGAVYISATGGTVTTSGDYKIHTFTGDGCFVVSCGGNPAGSDTVDYLVVAGGAGGGSSNPGNTAAGGGGGGFRESSGTVSGCYTVSPLGGCVSALPVSATTYPISVGGGGAGAPVESSKGGDGSNSVFSTITSAGGGGGGSNAIRSGVPGGSGGGGSGGDFNQPGGSGNTPPVSPPQGQPGGNSAPNPAAPPDQSSGGGGGATEAGVNGSSPGTASGRGGAGATTSISGSPIGYSGGGGGGGSPVPVTIGAASPCGSGSAGASGTPATNATANRGGGGGGVGACSSGGASGGKGIVIIRYKFQ